MIGRPGAGGSSSVPSGGADVVSTSVSKYSVTDARRAVGEITELGTVGNVCSPHDAIKIAAADTVRSEAINLGEDIFTPGSLPANRCSTRRHLLRFQGKR